MKALGMVLAVASAVIVLLAVMMSPQQLKDVDAGLVGYFSVSSADTVVASDTWGFASIEAVSGDVGLRVLGDKYDATDDSIVIQSGEILNLDLYQSGQTARAIAIYPGAGATARGLYW